LVPVGRQEMQCFEYCFKEFREMAKVSCEIQSVPAKFYIETLFPIRSEIAVIRVVYLINNKRVKKKLSEMSIIHKNTHFQDLEPGGPKHGVLGGLVT
jgi:hypothetical protein